MTEHKLHLKGGTVDLSNYSHTILKSEYRLDTGIIIDAVKYRQTSKSKGGWRRMYKSYTEAQELCIKGLSDLKIWNYIIDNTRSDFSFNVNFTKVAKKLGMSRQTIHSFMKRGLEHNVFKKIEEGYEFNPFIYCPFGASDTIVADKQQEWKDIDK